VFVRGWIAALVTVAALATGCHHRIDCNGPGNTSDSCSARPPASVSEAHALEQPSALAAGRGVLFIADDSRNTVFARQPDGQIHPVAGTGLRGFTGDGRLATTARLNDPSGMVYDPRTQTLFVADTGNNRIRAINRSGSIHTVVGSGRAGWVPSGTPALAADLTAPTAVALSPDGRLYIAAGLEVLRLDRDGRLTKIAGNRHGAGIAGADSPAGDASTDSANGLAFDAAGNLYLTGSATKGLLVITPAGRMHVLCATCLYPRGNAGIVTAPNGSVLVMNTEQIYRYNSPRRHSLLINFERHKPVEGVTGIAPTGLAVTPSGVIYIDTNENGGFTNATTLIKITPRGRLTVVWRR